MTITPIAVYFLYFIFSRPDSQLCTPQDRSNTCLSNDYQPVCAIYTGDDCNSPTDFCYRTLTSSCDACTDANIIGYTPGECEEPTLPQVCKKNQRGRSCTDEDEVSEPPVCGYIKPQRFRGKSFFSQTMLNGCDACSLEQNVFHIPGECQDSKTMGVCHGHRTTDCSADQTGVLCVYYKGDNCQEKICRKTEVHTCNVCQWASVLFYVKGACPGDEEVRPAVTTEDTSECYVETQTSIPEVQPVIQEDGTTVYDLVPPNLEETIPELVPVIQLDGSVVYEKVESLADKIIEMNPNVPEIEAVLQEGSPLIVEVMESRFLAKEPEN